MSPQAHQLPTTAEVRVRRFIGERGALGETLVVPLRVVWREYKSWCEARGLEADAAELRSVLASVPWAEVVGPRGTGAIRTIVRGLGLQPKVLHPPARR